MRVQNPNLLAQVILKKDKGWSEARVESTFDAGDDHHVALDQKIPVYVTYFTLRVNEDGSFTSFNDLYGHDFENDGGARRARATSAIRSTRTNRCSPESGANQRRRVGRRGSPSAADFTRGLFGF